MTEPSGRTRGQPQPATDTHDNQPGDKDDATPHVLREYLLISALRGPPVAQLAIGRPDERSHRE